MICKKAKLWWTTYGWSSPWRRWIEATIILHSVGLSRRYNLTIAMLFFYCISLNLDLFHIPISFDDVFPNYLQGTITMTYGWRSPLEWWIAVMTVIFNNVSLGVTAAYYTNLAIANPIAILFYNTIYGICMIVSLILFWGICWVTLMINNFIICVTSWRLAFKCVY